MIDTTMIRKRSWEKATQLGYRKNEALPLMEAPTHTRSKDDIVDRLFAMHCAAASACGFSRKKALSWYRREATQDFTDAEKAFLIGDNPALSEFTDQIEGMWALCWCLNMVNELRFDEPCSESFVKLLPDLKRSESGLSLRSQSSFRDICDILSALDLAYCLHWCMVDRLLTEGSTSNIRLYGVVERRRALEWVISTEAWENVPLDT
jgi:hypothetical protein